MGAVIVVFGLSAAACASTPAPSSTMTLGSRVAPPVEFISFCQRQPGECEGFAEAEGRVAQSRAAPVANALPTLTWAGRENAPLPGPASGLEGRRQGADWSALFSTVRFEEAAGRPAIAAVATATVEPVASPAPAGPRRGSDWSALFVAARYAREPLATDKALPDPSVSAVRVTFDRATLATLSKVNDRVNAAIIHRPDAETSGKADYWALPLELGQRYGDCEDYVLEKRRALIAEGVPASALSIALVLTPWGESHAVLLVATDKGDYALDNLTPWILAWSKTGYRWLARQAPGDNPTEWVSLARATGR